MKTRDIVLYNNTGILDPKHRNMLTMILNVHGDEVEIRFHQSTLRVSKKFCHSIPVSENFPIQVPEEPFVRVENENGAKGRHFPMISKGLASGFHVASSGNEAEFASIPLEWFEFDLPI